MSKKVIQLDLPMDVEFDMQQLMEDLVKDAQKAGCVSQSDIEEYIENGDFSVSIFANNVTNLQIKYYNLNYQFDEIMVQLNLYPLSDKNIKLIENILNNQ